MATSGKKGKKAKGKTISLNDFLSVGSNDDGSKVVVAAPTSWADEMDEYDESSSRGTEHFVLPTAPRAARGPDASDERIPRDPPYTAYVANLSYDIDEEDVLKFFSRLKIKGVRLPRDGDPETGRLKGFGYADFEDRDSLVEALSMNDHLLKNRKVRIDLATHAGKGDRDHGGRDGGGGGQGNRSRYDDGGEDRTAGDWRSGPPAPQRDDDRRKDRFEPARDRDDRRENRGYGFDRREGGGGFDRDRRDGGGFDRDRRDGGGFDRDRRDGGGFDRDRRDGGGFDRDRRDGFGRDSHDRDRREGGGFERRGNYDRSDRRSPERDAPRERPKLQLSKRTVAAEEEAKLAAAQSSIFGGAKPVDTTKREKEIEEKLKKPSADERIKKPVDTDTSSRHSEEDLHEDSHKDDTIDPDHHREKSSKPKGASIFGQAKPVDTTAREKEIEERLRKKDEKPDGEHEERKKIVLTRGDEGHQNIHSGHERRGVDDRSQGNRGHRDGPRRDDRRDDWRDDRHDDRGPRRDPVPPQKHQDRKQDRSTPPPKKFEEPPPPQQESDQSSPQMKKLEEQPPPNFAGANKFSFLRDSEDVGSGQDSE